MIKKPDVGNIIASFIVIVTAMLLLSVILIIEALLLLPFGISYVNFGYLFLYVLVTCIIGIFFDLLYSAVWDKVRMQNGISLLSKITLFIGLTSCSIVAFIISDVIIDSVEAPWYGVIGAASLFSIIEMYLYLHNKDTD
jgi:hypothetical protein